MYSKINSVIWNHDILNCNSVFSFQNINCNMDTYVLVGRGEGNYALIPEIPRKNWLNSDWCRRCSGSPCLSLCACFPNNGQVEVSDLLTERSGKIFRTICTKVCGVFFFKLKMDWIWIFLRNKSVYEIEKCSKENGFEKKKERTKTRICVNHWLWTEEKVHFALCVWNVPSMWEWRCFVLRGRKGKGSNTLLQVKPFWDDE